MQYIEKVGRAIYSVSEFYRDINPSTLTGAIDVVVVEDELGILSSSPFHVRFGKLKVLLPTEKIVTVAVNGRPVGIQMKVGDAGESFFVVEATGSEPVPADLATSPLAKPAASLRKEIEALDLNQRIFSDASHAHHEYPLSDSEIETGSTKRLAVYHEGALSDSELEVSAEPPGALVSGVGSALPEPAVALPSSPTVATDITTTAATTKGAASTNTHNATSTGDWSWGWGRLPVRQSTSLESLDRSVATVREQAGLQPDMVKRSTECKNERPFFGVPVDVSPDPMIAAKLASPRSKSNEELRRSEPLPARSAPGTFGDHTRIKVADWITHAQYISLVEHKLAAFKERVTASGEALFDSLLVLSQCAQLEILPQLQSLQAVFDEHVLPAERFSLSSGGSSLLPLAVMQHSGDETDRRNWPYLLLNVPSAGSAAGSQSGVSSAAATVPCASQPASPTPVSTARGTSVSAASSSALGSPSSASTAPVVSPGPLSAGTNAGVSSGSGWRSWWSRAAPATDRPVADKEKPNPEVDKAAFVLPVSGAGLSEPAASASSPKQGLLTSQQGDSSVSVESEAPPNRHYLKSLRLTHEQLVSLNLKPGCNTVSFTVGRASCSAKLYRWRYDSKIVISDIDGTITKSDVFGHLFTMVGKDWTHSGVAHLFSRIKANGYEILYLTSRAIGQADTTRYYLKGVEQGQWQLPDGPVIMSPDRLFTAFHREVIMRRPEEFKIACLRDMLRLFNASWGFGFNSGSDWAIRRPFFAGFGNRTTDALSYKSVGIPTSRIFTINSYGDVSLELLSSYKSSYIGLTDLVDAIFAPVHTAMKDEEYSDLNYWSTPRPSPVMAGKGREPSGQLLVKSLPSPKWSPLSGSLSTNASTTAPSSPLLLASVPADEASGELLLKEPSSPLELSLLVERADAGGGQPEHESSESSEGLEPVMDLSAMPWIQKAIQRQPGLLYQMRTEEQLEAAFSKGDSDGEEDEDEDEEIEYPYI